jgi:Sec-independent protein translocase protein TatA
MTWLMSQAWFRQAAIIGAAVLAIVLFVFGQRKAGERVGAMKVKLEAAKNAAKVKAKMDSVPRPSKSDVVDKLHDGKF